MGDEEIEERGGEEARKYREGTGGGTGGNTGDEDERKEAGFAQQKQSSLSREERYGTGAAVAGSEEIQEVENVYE